MVPDLTRCLQKGQPAVVLMRIRRQSTPQDVVGLLVAATADELVANLAERIGAGVVVEDDPTYDHDLIVAGRTVDVKTKERTVAPELHYDCTVPDYNREFQQPEVYLFVSLLTDRSEGCSRFVRGWVLGSIAAVKFDRIAERWTPQQTDLTNGWRPTIACRNVKVSALNPTVRSVHN